MIALSVSSRFFHLNSGATSLVSDSTILVASFLSHKYGLAPHNSSVTALVPRSPTAFLVMQLCEGNFLPRPIAACTCLFVAFLQSNAVQTVSKVNQSCFIGLDYSLLLRDTSKLRLFFRVTQHITYISATDLKQFRFHIL